LKERLLAFIGASIVASFTYGKIIGLVDILRHRNILPVCLIDVLIDWAHLIFFIFFAAHRRAIASLILNRFGRACGAGTLFQVRDLLLFFLDLLVLILAGSVALASITKSNVTFAGELLGGLARLPNVATADFAVVRLVRVVRVIQHLLRT